MEVLRRAVPFDSVRWTMRKRPWLPISFLTTLQSMKMTPSRGEVWLFDLGMAEKVRPALVVSVGYGDADRALITVLPHATSLRGSQYGITVNIPFLKAAPSWSRTWRHT